MPEFCNIETHHYYDEIVECKEGDVGKNVYQNTHPLCLIGEEWHAKQLFTYEEQGDYHHVCIDQLNDKPGPSGESFYIRFN